jgi:hypothetical protein
MPTHIRTNSFTVILTKPNNNSNRDGISRTNPQQHLKRTH